MAARLHVRQPLRFRGHESGPTLRAPLLGEHTREVLAEAGIASAEIDALIAADAAADGAKAR